MQEFMHAFAFILAWSSIGAMFCYGAIMCWRGWQFATRHRVELSRLTEAQLLGIQADRRFHAAKEFSQRQRRALLQQRCCR